MKQRDCCVIAVSLFLTSLSSLLIAADGVDMPKAATPRLAVVKSVSTDADTITCSWVLSRPIWETRSREQNGRTVTTQAVHCIPETRSATFSLSKATFFDAQGQSLSKEEFTSRVRLGNTILFSEDGKAVDQTYLRILKSDVLVLVPSEDELGRNMTPRRPAPPASAPPVPTPPPPLRTF